MIIYVESNFILQLALRQEEATSAEAILELAEKGDLELAFRAFSLSEPFSTIAYRSVERKKLFNLLSEQLTQLQRSVVQQPLASNFQSLIDSWRSSDAQDNDTLQVTVQRLLRAGRQIETVSQVFNQAISYQSSYGLSPQDSIIYSAVISDLQRQVVSESKCFISTNSKDFGDPGIKRELKSYNCRYISSFGDGLKFAKRGK